MESQNVQALLTSLLPKHISAPDFARQVVVAATRNPDLLGCDTITVVRAALDSAVCGLDCSGASQEAALVPYGGEAVFIPMYQGLVKLMYNSPRVLLIDTGVVHERDVFSYQKIPPQLSHVPCDDADPGKRLGAYAVVWLKDAPFPLIEWMPERAIQTIKGRSKARKGPWNDKDFEDEMARKCPLRNIAKRVPKSAELASALASDRGLIIDVPSEPATLTETNGRQKVDLKGFDPEKVAEPEEAAEPSEQTEQKSAEQPETAKEAPAEELFGDEHTEDDERSNIELALKELRALKVTLPAKYKALLKRIALKESELPAQSLDLLRDMIADLKS